MICSDCSLFVYLFPVYVICNYTTQSFLNIYLCVLAIKFLVTMLKFLFHFHNFQLLDDIYKSCFYKNTAHLLYRLCLGVPSICVSHFFVVVRIVCVIFSHFSLSVFSRLHFKIIYRNHVKLNLVLCLQG